MILRPAPEKYSREDEGALRDAIRRADGENLKRDRDIELNSGRIILTSADGSQFVLTVTNGGVLGTSGL